MRSRYFSHLGLGQTVIDPFGSFTSVVKINIKSDFFQADLSLVIFEGKNILTENPENLNNYVLLTASLCLWSIIILIQFYFWFLTMLEYFEMKKKFKSQEVEENISHVSQENPIRRSRTNISVRDSLYQSNVSLNRDLHRNSIYQSQMSIHNI